jgi:hypothetical protein
VAGAATLAAKREASGGRTMAGLPASGLCVFGVSVFGVSVFGVGAFGVGAFGVSAFGVGAFGGWRAADRVGVAGLIDVVAVAIGLEH